MEEQALDIHSYLRSFRTNQPWKKSHGFCREVAVISALEFGKDHGLPHGHQLVVSPHRADNHERQRMRATATPRIPVPKRTVKTAQGIIDWDGEWKSSPLHNGKRAEATLARADTGIAKMGRQPFLIVYYGSDGSGGWQPLDRPLRTLTTLDRFGLVTWEGRTPMLRMLQVPELKRAMGFNEAFQLSYGARRDRIKLLGNGVCPPVMKAIVQSLVG